MQQTIRTFLAVETPPYVRERIGKLTAELRGLSGKVTWVPPTNLHWTLKFLGDVPTREIPDICGSLAKAVRPVEVFDVEVRGAGAFPSPQRPRTLWLGAGQGADEMVELHLAIESALAPHGFRKEARRFRPHITMGRVRGETDGEAYAEVLGRHKDYEAGVMNVSEVVLFSSVLERSGAVYETLATLPLSGRP